MAENASFFYEPFFQKAFDDVNFIHNFKGTLITEMDHLAQVIEENKERKLAAVDTETNGLTFFVNQIVGFSFSFDDINGFYVPLRHNTGVNADMSLLQYFYEHVMLTKNILFFNSMFDCFMFKGEGLDMQKVKIFECQVLVYNADSDILRKNLKFSTQHYLGRTPPTFNDTLLKVGGAKADIIEQTTKIELYNKMDIKKLEIQNKELELPSTEIEADPKALKIYEKEKKAQAKVLIKELALLEKEMKVLLKDINKLRTKIDKNTTFQDLDPIDSVEYASNDACNTFGLFQKLYPILEKECKFVLNLDNRLVKALHFYAESPVYLDNEKMKALCVDLENEINELSPKIFEFFGYPFNLDCLVYSTKVQIKYRDPYKLIDVETEVDLKQLYRLYSKNKHIDILTPDGYHPITAFAEVGRKKKIIITLEDDKFLECSYNELILTKKDEDYFFKLANKLTLEDDVIIDMDTVPKEKIDKAFLLLNK